MTTRVTHRTIQESTLANLQGNLHAMAGLQQQLSTGKRINRPSDDPSGTVSALRLRQDLRANEQHTRNADDGTGWLNAADTALQTTSSQLRAARGLVLKALNDGAQSGESRAAVAVELDGIRQTVVGLANTQYLGRNVFAGTSGPGPALTGLASSSQFYDATGQTFPISGYTFASTGTDPAARGTVQRQVDAASSVRVDVDGASVFGADPTSGPPTAADGSDQSVFALLDQIAVEVRKPGTTTATLSTLLGRLDTHLNSVLTGLADVGARTNRIQRAQDAAADAKLTLTSQLSDAEDVDLPATIVDLQMQQAAYQAALGATAKVLQPSLMDFLK